MALTRATPDDFAKSNSRFKRLDIFRIDPPYNRLSQKGGLQPEHIHWFASQDPNAVFIFPDNAKDFHAGKKQPGGRAGLAKAMRPTFKEGVFDFLGSGIATGRAGGLEGQWDWSKDSKGVVKDEKQAKDYIRKGFIEIYKYLGEGKNIVVPFDNIKLPDESVVYGPAFGYGFFANFPRDLYDFITLEFDKLEKICKVLERNDEKEIAIAFLDVDRAYNDAYYHLDVYYHISSTRYDLSEKVKNPIGQRPAYSEQQPAPVRAIDRVQPVVRDFDAEMAALDELTAQYSKLYTAQIKAEKEAKELALKKLAEKESAEQKAQVSKETGLVKDIRTQLAAGNESSITLKYKTLQEFKNIHQQLTSVIKDLLPDDYKPTDPPIMSASSAVLPELKEDVEKSISLKIIKGKDYSDTNKKDITVYTCGDEPSRASGSIHALKVLHLSSELRNELQDSEQKISPNLMQFAKKVVDDFTQKGRAPITVKGSNPSLVLAVKCYCEIMKEKNQKDKKYDWVDPLDVEGRRLPSKDLLQSLKARDFGEVAPKTEAKSGDEKTEASRASEFKEKDEKEEVTPDPKFNYAEFKGILSIYQSEQPRKPDEQTRQRHVEIIKNWVKEFHGFKDIFVLADGGTKICIISGNKKRVDAFENFVRKVEKGPDVTDDQVKLLIATAMLKKPSISTILKGLGTKPTESPSESLRRPFR